MSNIEKNFILEAKNLSKSFSDGKLNVQVLSHIDLTVAAGESIAIVGRSGSGKSTLLQVLGGLDKPTSGEIILAGERYETLNEAARCELRNRKLGFVYQFHHLLPEFTALENVMMPLLLRGDMTVKEAAVEAEMILEKVGLSKRLEHKVGELSGGERQRVAIARALVTKPACMLADEPTGNLDQQTAEVVLQQMIDLKNELNTSLIIVTHDASIAAKMDRVLTLADGKLSA